MFSYKILYFLPALHHEEVSQRVAMLGLVYETKNITCPLFVSTWQFESTVHHQKHIFFWQLNSVSCQCYHIIQQDKPENITSCCSFQKMHDLCFYTSHRTSHGVHFSLVSAISERLEDQDHINKAPNFVYLKFAMINK